ncbi:hypothetical protein TrRE_jg2841 [Triparma retinervis]|uniref:Uncharacterized protein n=1 Tax=Triparma retinervis TaxID=2557542 RepID=A0A9W7A7Q5_9STRA|nr:hypothetical protein TrRE_jg2841 [Triparma retinervis]
MEFKRFFGAEVDDIASTPPKSTSPRLSTAEWAVLTNKHISFYHPDNSRPRFRIPTIEIVGAKMLDARQRPSFPSYHFIEIETLGRYYYLVLQNDACSRGGRSSSTTSSRLDAPTGAASLAHPDDRSSYSFRDTASSDGRSSNGTGGGSGGSGGGITGGGDWAGVTSDPSELDLASVYYLQESVSVVTKSKGVQVTLPQNNPSIHPGSLSGISLITFGRVTRPFFTPTTPLKQFLPCSTTVVAIVM